MAFFGVSSLNRFLKRCNMFGNSNELRETGRRHKLQLQSTVSVSVYWSMGEYAGGGTPPLFVVFFTVCFRSLLPAYIADMPGKNLTMVKKAQMITMYKEGKSMTKIAKELGGSKTTVAIWCNRARDGDLETALQRM